jgi:DNA-binding MarR family transcriptional regulator
MPDDDMPSPETTQAKHCERAAIGRYDWMAAVLADAELTQAQRLVAMRVALHLNAKTGRCDPGTRTIAVGTGCDRTTTIRAIKALVARGWITIERSRGWHRNNMRLTTPNGGAPDTVQTVALPPPSSSRNGGAPAQRTVAPVHLNGGRASGHVVEFTGKARRNTLENTLREHPKRETRARESLILIGEGKEEAKRDTTTTTTINGATPLPENWGLSSALFNWLLDLKGWDYVESDEFLRMVAIFKDACRDKGRVNADWDAGFKNWFRRYEENEAKSRAHGRRRRPPPGLRRLSDLPDE